MDTTTKVLTGLVVGSLLLPLALALTVPGGHVVLAVAILVVLPLTWALSPAGYRLEGVVLEVRRRRWRPFTATVEALSDHPKPARLGLRIAGSGGAFGWWGRFRRRDIGGYRAYLTTRDAAAVVALRTSAGIVVVSPADPAAFTAAVTRALRP